VAVPRKRRLSCGEDDGAGGVVGLELGQRTFGRLCIGGLALLCASAAAGAAEKKTPPKHKPPVGLLRVLIRGLPTATPAAVTVTGPNHFRVRITKTASFGVRPGRYAAAAAKVSTGAAVYMPAKRSTSIYLARGKHQSLAVVYTRLVPAPSSSTAPSSGGSGGTSGTAPGTPAAGGTTTPTTTTAATGGGGGASGGGGGGGSGGGGASSGDPGTTTGAGGSTGAVHLFLGYADLYRANGAAVPSPWSGSAGVTFVGCNSTLVADPGATCNKTSGGKDDYDAGALRFDNGSSGPVTIANVTVQIGSCFYNPWRGLNVTLQPGNTLILTQTGGSNPCGEDVGPDNFDTSESNATCTNKELIPVITMSINGTTTTVADTGQILNTGGADKGDCGNKPNEYHEWVQVT